MAVRVELVGGYSDGRVETMEFITPYVEVPIPQPFTLTRMQDREFDPTFRVDRYRATHRITADGAWVYVLESSDA